MTGMAARRFARRAIKDPLLRLVRAPALLVHACPQAYIL